MTRLPSSRQTTRKQSSFYEHFACVRLRLDVSRSAPKIRSSPGGCMRLYSLLQ